MFPEQIYCSKAFTDEVPTAVKLRFSHIDRQAGNTISFAKGQISRDERPCHWL
jgi:hypothetical protein